MRLVLLGAPGSGKGTQGAELAQRLGVPYVSSGELLRNHAAAQTELGRRVAPYLNRGDLAPDELVLAAVSDALAAPANAGGYVLEGFPRTTAQASSGDVPSPDAVVYLALPDEVARQRLARRAAAGRTDDADPEAIERRFRLFHAETEPLIDFYRQHGLLTTVDANQPVDAVTAAILDALNVPYPHK
jgi:adenylate kinase